MTGKFMAALAQVIVGEEFVCKSINSSDVQVSELGYMSFFFYNENLYTRLTRLLLGPEIRININNLY